MEQNSNPINVKSLLGKLRAHRWAFIIAWVVTVVATGALTYLLPRKWKATTEFVPEYNLQEAKDLQDIMRDNEIDMDIARLGDAFTQRLYVDMVGDYRFMQTLSQAEVTDSKGEKHIIKDLYPDAKAPNTLYKLMAEDIQCKESRKTGGMMLSVVAEDPQIAQEIAIIAREQLAEQIRVYRQEKAQRDVELYSQRAEESEIAANLMQVAKLRTEQHQPVFVIIQEAALPDRPISPRRMLIVVIMLLVVTLGMTGWYWRKDIPEWL